MQTITLKAPAKINLYLNVLNKRPDGFHNIETIFEKLDFGDEITLTKCKKGIKVSCSHKNVPENGKNLTVQAARSLFKAAGSGAGIEIKINKKIPVAAGLGGGSSDAASVLLGLNRLFSFGFSRTNLGEIAAGLGSDVPFFIFSGSRALGRGKGEKLIPLAQGKRNWYVLVMPDTLRLSTKKMYQHPRLTLTKAPQSAKIMLHALEKGDITSLNKCSYNSFESIVAKKYREIKEIKKALKSLGAHTTLMSGSGPCVFGITASGKEAISIGRKLQAKRKGWQVIVTRTYNANKEE